MAGVGELWRLFDGGELLERAADWTERERVFSEVVDMVGDRYLGGQFGLITVERMARNEWQLNLGKIADNFGHFVDNEAATFPKMF